MRPLLWLIRPSSQLSADWHSAGRRQGVQPELRGDCGCLRLERMLAPGPHQSPPQLCCVVHPYTSASGLSESKVQVDR